ncbi:MAG: hypothetical protein WDO18_06415 [Acidobacteriota bacterium]
MNSGLTLDAETIQRLAAFENDPAIVYLLDRDRKIAWCNQAWSRFAIENGAPELVGRG